jgi:hypothetical protein
MECRKLFTNIPLKSLFVPSRAQILENIKICLEQFFIIIPSMMKLLAEEKDEVSFLSFHSKQHDTTRKENYESEI